MCLDDNVFTRQYLYCTEVESSVHELHIETQGQWYFKYRTYYRTAVNILIILYYYLLLLNMILYTSMLYTRQLKGHVEQI